MKPDFLDKVQRPGRYIGNEWNSWHKDIKEARVKFALCFPDLYEIGMSNLGVRILYDLLNRQDGIACQRCFCPGMDMVELIKNDPSASLSSLESDVPLKDFDIIGFSISGESQFTNFLNMLFLSGIPFNSVERDDKYPLIIAGGQIGLNPEPLSGFIDAFVIGEGEEVILDMISVYKKYREDTGDGRRGRLLRGLAEIEGVYVPSLYEVNCNRGKGMAAISPKHGGLAPFIQKRFIRDLDAFDFPGSWLVPYIQIVHDRIAVEVMRGCGNNCRFCQARWQYFPYRIRKSESIAKSAGRFLRSSGYEEFSLLGLSVGDYPGLGEMIKSLSDDFKGLGVNISLPSLKAKDFLKHIPGDLAKTRKTTLTFAPEAGSERLRALLRKDLDIADLLEVAKSAYQAGYSHIKLYFMIGLPTETNADLDAIFDFSLKLAELRREVAGKTAFVNLSVSNFVPKPHTPFQWLAMENSSVLSAKQSYLREKFRRRANLFKISFHDIKVSMLESALGRGGRKSGAVIARAWEKGAGFDAWTEHFNFNLWQEAFLECGQDINAEAAKSFKLDEALPWEHIHCGADKGRLKKELLDAAAGNPGLLEGIV